MLDENYFFHQCDDAIVLKTPFISQKIQKIIPQIPLETVKILSEISKIQKVKSLLVTKRILIVEIKHSYTTQKSIQIENLLIEIQKTLSSQYPPEKVFVFY